MQGVGLGGSRGRGGGASTTLCAGVGGERNEIIKEKVEEEKETKMTTRRTIHKWRVVIC